MVEISFFTLSQVKALTDVFGYDVVVDGDSMTAEVYCGSHYCYKIALI